LTFARRTGGRRAGHDIRVTEVYGMIAEMQWHGPMPAPDACARCLRQSACCSKTQRVRIAA
jgi:hypothetical protein